MSAKVNIEEIAKNISFLNLGENLENKHPDPLNKRDVIFVVQYYKNWGLTR